VEGGWMPLALGGMVMVVMYTWWRGSHLLLVKTRKQEMPLESLIAKLERKPPTRVPGAAVFLTSDPDFAPTALLHSHKHYKVLHENNVILTVETTDTPRVDPAERVRLEPTGETFTRGRLRFGFMEAPNVPRALALARKLGWQFDIMSTSFFQSRRSLKPAVKSEMPHWQDKLFIALTRIANDATNYFQQSCPTRISSRPYLIAHRTTSIAATMQHHLPLIAPLPPIAIDGAIMWYGVDIFDEYRRGARYVDRILRGEKPADLQVQLPTKYLFIINLKSAKSPGIAVPPSLLVQADKVIE
jgi:hypothetical protein